MKKILPILTIALFVPLLAAAVARAPVKTSPLQPLPGNTAPTVNANINTPGNPYNQNQSQIQSQDENNPADNQNSQSSSPNESLPSVSQVSSSSTFYVVLIVVCSICLLLMFAYIFFRFRKKAT